MRLTDYKVRIIDSTTGTAATTRVLIQSSDGVSEWGTIGVNENIVEASLQALVDSLECALIHSRRRRVITTIDAEPRIPAAAASPPAVLKRLDA